MNYIELTGNCPVQGKKFTVSAKLFSQSEKHIGRIECEYIYNGNGCPHSSCPIVKQNGYHH